MGSNGRQSNLHLDRLKEYQRQQERLKAMASTTDKVKPITADLMIENLLRETAQMSQQRRTDVLYSELPLWLQCESSLVPAEYKYLWSLVQLSVDLADTQKVSQLLLTSGLHIDVLGYIWNIANKAIPGQLTKQEFFIVLALVNLAQSGSTFNNLNILKFIPAPVIPTLHLNVSKMEPSSVQSCPQPDSSQVSHIQKFPTVDSPSVSLLTDGHKNNSSPVNLQYQHLQKPSGSFNYNSPEMRLDVSIVSDRNKTDSNRGVGKAMDASNSPKNLDGDLFSNSNFPCLGSSPTTELEDDFSDFQSVTAETSVSESTAKPVELSDEFSDFQSAEVVNVQDPLKTVVLSQKREISKIPLPKNLAGKFTNLKSNFLKISPESERKLKVLYPNESLSSLPESKISSTNQVSTSMSVLGSSHEIGSRLANHSLGVKSTGTRVHKHQKIKTNPSHSSSQSSEDEIIFGVNTKNLVENIIPKCCPKRTFLLKETKIEDDNIIEFTEADQSDSNQVDCPGENTRQIKIPMLGTFNETVLPTQTKIQPSGGDLISVEEDKYSALRDLEMETKGGEALKEQEVTCDDFGDFLSADIPTQSFNEPEVAGSQDQPKVSNDWAEWSCNFETNNNKNNTEPSEMDDISASNTCYNNVQIPKGQTNSSRGLDTTSYEPFGLINVDCAVPEAVDTTSSIQSSFTTLESSPRLTETTAVTSNENNNKLNVDLFQSIPSEAICSQEKNQLWDLLETPDPPKATIEVNSSTRDSPPSLDLSKMSLEKNLDQSTIWKKCLVSCQMIIQEGVQIFDGINKKSVLKEVLAAPKTKDYLNGLWIAYHITKRINQNYTETNSVQEDLNKLWEKLEKLCLEYNIQFKQDVDTVSEGKHQCYICQGCLGDDCVHHQGQNYHLSCANLWVNCIERTLPCLS